MNIAGPIRWPPIHGHGWTVLLGCIGRCRCCRMFRHVARTRCWARLADTQIADGKLAVTTKLKFRCGTTTVAWHGRDRETTFSKSYLPKTTSSALPRERHSLPELLLIFPESNEKSSRPSPTETAIAQLSKETEPRPSSAVRHISVADVIPLAIMTC